MAQTQPKRHALFKKVHIRRLYYGWVIVIVMAVLQFAGGTETHPVLGIFLKPMTEEFGWSRTNFSAPLTIGTFLGGLLGLVVGPALDRYGGKWILAIAALFLGTVFMLMGSLQELWQHYILQTLARTIIAGTFFMVVSIIIPKWFVEKRGRATAYAGLGGRAGHFLLPLMVQRVNSFAGWRMAWMSLGMIVWSLTVVPVILLLRRRPEDMGLLPDGVTPGEAGTTSEGSPNETSPGTPPAREEVSMGTREVLRTRAFYLILTAQSLLTFAIAGTHFHWFAYLTGHGISEEVAVGSIAISALAGIPVSLGAGFLAERIHVRYILAATYVALAGTIVMLVYTTTPVMAYVFAIALGTSSGVIFTLSLIVWADYFGRHSVGAIRGLTAPVNMFTNAMGPLLAAVVFDVTGSYTLILWIFAIVVGGSTICWFLAVPPQHSQSQGKLKGYGV